VEPEVLLNGEHSIDRTLEVAEKVGTKCFFSTWHSAMEAINWGLVSVVMDEP